MVKDEEFPKLENPKLGTEFELNDNRGVIVGIAKVPSGALFGTPTLYTTYYRAIQYIPSMRFTISYILVEPKTDSDIPYIKRAGCAARLPRADKRGVPESNLRLPEIQDGDRHQYAADDSDQLSSLACRFPVRPFTRSLSKTSNTSARSRRWGPKGVSWSI